MGISLREVRENNQPFCSSDTSYGPDFFDNPLVTAPPDTRFCFGGPLALTPGVAVSTLCVIDTMPRTFGPEDFEELKELARMAAVELKITAISSLQNKLLLRLNTLQRKGALDPLTACWNIRGFLEPLDVGFDDPRRSGTEFAPCQIRVNNFQELPGTAQYASVDAATQGLAQVLRQRQPPQGARSARTAKLLRTASFRITAGAGASTRAVGLS